MSVEIRPIVYEDIAPHRRAATLDGLYMVDHPKSTWWGAFVGGQLVGFTCGTIMGGTVRYRASYVLPAHRGKGIYRLLFRTRHIHFVKAGHKKFSAFCNSRSVGLFRQLGWKEHTTPGRATSFMTKDLTSKYK